MDQRHAIAIVDVTTGAITPLIRDATGGLDRPHVSPDDRWIAFRRIAGASGKSYVTALNRGKVIAPEAAQEIQEPTATGRPTGWSPDSRILYLLLDTDGFRCLWAQRINAKGGLEGAPYAARHFHKENNLGDAVSTSFGNSITTDGFMYDALEMAGDVWRLIVRN
jgi:hypothetical protein